jgi:hypothetical protein
VFSSVEHADAALEAKQRLLCDVTGSRWLICKDSSWLLHTQTLVDRLVVWSVIAVRAAVHGPTLLLVLVRVTGLSVGQWRLQLKGWQQMKQQLAATGVIVDFDFDRFQCAEVQQSYGYIRVLEGYSLLAAVSYQHCRTVVGLCHYQCTAPGFCRFQKGFSCH